jgi:NAD(P)-dependent dehydrogenase (short-subunit alcohol dehydrogenase family)
MAELINRVALVIGASRGIGAAIAIALGHAGTAVAVNYRDEARRRRTAGRPTTREFYEYLGFTASRRDTSAETVIARVPSARTAIERLRCPELSASIDNLGVCRTAAKSALA